MSLIGVISSQPKTINTSKKTFESIKAQTKQLDIIYWFYPRFSKRFNIPYPDVPDWVSEYDNLKVVRCEDYGPATKVIPLLDMDVEDDARIIIFDDDCVYPKNNVELLNKHYRRDVGLGFMGSLRTYIPFKNMLTSGKAFKTNGLSFLNRVNIMLCSSMVIYPRRMYPKTSQGYLDDMKKVEGSFLNDDLMNTYYAHKNGIKLYIINNDELSSFQEEKQDGMLTGTNTPGKFYAKMALKNQANIPFYIILIPLVVIIFLCYLAFKMIS